MKQLFSTALCFIAFATFAIEPPMWHISSRGIVNGVIGYKGETPVTLYIHADTVVCAVLEKNQETRAFLQVVIDAGLLDSWNGCTLKEAANIEVDAITAATRSSNAIIKTVQSLATFMVEKEAQKSKNFWENHWLYRYKVVSL